MFGLHNLTYLPLERQRHFSLILEIFCVDLSRAGISDVQNADSYPGFGAAVFHQCAKTEREIAVFTGIVIGI